METKPQWKSQTLIGLAIVVLPNVLRLVDNLFGTKLDNPDLTAICTVVGGVLGYNGRMNATVKLK